MDEKIMRNDLLKVYESNDEKLFRKINKKYNLGLNSIDEIPLVEIRPSIDLNRYFEDYDAKYFINYNYSRLILDLDEPVEKHVLDEDRFNIVSYSYFIFNVLTELENNPKLDEVLNQVDLNLDKDVVKDLLISKGFVNLRRNGNATVTSYGKMRLRGVSWVALYKTCLDYFDFSDFEFYMKDNDTGSVIKNAHNYLNENLKVAYDRKEFNRLHDVFAAKAALFVFEKDFEEALKEELKLFILKLNPIYLDDFDNYNAVKSANINNLDLLSALAEIEIEDIFDECWDDVKLDSKLMSKKEAIDYYNRADSGEFFDELSLEIQDKYFS